MARPLLVTFTIAAAAAVAACGSQGIELAANESPEVRRGAELFSQRCAGCHTMTVVGAEGGSQSVGDSEYKDGPNFDERRETYEDVLYAIRNGGFSSGPMPQNIVVGQEAEDVARFLEKYSGRKRSSE